MGMKDIYLYSFYRKQFVKRQCMEVKWWYMNEYVMILYIIFIYNI